MGKSVSMVTTLKAQNPPKFCQACGKELVASAETKFDPHTGQRVEGTKLLNCTSGNPFHGYFLYKDEWLSRNG